MTEPTRYVRGLQHAMRTLENNADDLGWVERDMARAAVSEALRAALSARAETEATASVSGEPVAWADPDYLPMDADDRMTVSSERSEVYRVPLYVGSSPATVKGAA